MGSGVFEQGEQVVASDDAEGHEGGHGRDGVPAEGRAVLAAVEHRARLAEAEQKVQAIVEGPAGPALRDVE